MKKQIFTFLTLGLLLAGSSLVFSQSYGLYAEKPGYMMDGDFLTDPDLTGAYIGADKTATVSLITSGHADSVYFGMNAIHTVFTDNVDGKDRLEIKVGAEADMTNFSNAELVFWIKLLQRNDMHFEVNANRNGGGEVKGSDESMVENHGLDTTSNEWQKITIDLTKSIDGDNFTYDLFESFGFRSRGMASEFLIDEMHVVYYGAYGMYTEKLAWSLDGDFLTEFGDAGAYIGVDKGATFSYITSGDADSVYFGMEAIHAVFTDNVDGKDRLEFKVKPEVDLSAFDGGELVFYVKLLDTLDMHFEVNANRNAAGEAKGTDVSMVENYGLDRMDTVSWQKISIDLSQKVKNDVFTYDIFESFGFRSRGNACNFLIDEMHVILRGGYGIFADNAGYKTEGDFLTDEALDSAYVGVDKNATFSIITSGHPDSVYFGMNAVHATFTDDADGKDRLEFKVKSEADMTPFNAGTLTFWIKLLQPLDMYFEVNANRNGGGEVKGSDESLVDNHGLDLADTAWQKITIDLSSSIGGDNFSYDMFESFGFRSRGNACDFLIDEMHVRFTAPLMRGPAEMPSNVATLSDLTVSVGSLDPVFDAGTTTYNVELPQGTTSVDVTATPTDTSATISGDGTVDVSSGSATATVTVTAEDGTTTMEYVISFTVATGVEEDLLSAISIYPNPASSMLTIELGGAEVNMVEIANLLGQTVISQFVQSDRMVFDVSELNEGLYIVTFDTVPHSKIIIQR